MDPEDRPPVLVESDESEEETELGDLREQLQNFAPKFHRQKVHSEAHFKFNQGRRRREQDRKEGGNWSVFARLGRVEQGLSHHTRKGATKKLQGDRYSQPYL